MIAAIKLIVAALFLSATSIGLGAWVFKRYFKEHGLPSLALYYFSGQVGVSLLFILLSAILKYPANTIVSFVLSVPFAVSGFGYIKSIKLRAVTHKYLFEKVLAALIIGILIINFIRAFSTPIAWDDVVYHLPVVREIAGGRVTFPLLKDSPFLDFQRHFSVLFGSLPYASESFSAYLYSMSGLNIHSAQLMNYINLLVFISFLSTFLIDEFKQNLTSRLVVVFIFISSWSVFQITSTGYVDINVLIYQFLSLVFLLKSRRSGKIEYLYPSALFMGYTLGMKYTALYLFPIYALFVLSILVKQKKGLQINTLLKLITLGIAGGGFWYVKNIITFV